MLYADSPYTYLHIVYEDFTCVSVKDYKHDAGRNLIIFSEIYRSYGPRFV